MVSPRGLRNEAQIAMLGLAVVMILGYIVVLHEQLAAQPWFADEARS